MLLHGNKGNAPLVSRELEEDHAVSPDSERGAYDFSTDGGDSLVMPPMVDLASQGLRRSPRLANQKRPNYACSVLKNFCKFAYSRKKVGGWWPNSAFDFQSCFCLRGSVRLS